MSTLPTETVVGDEISAGLVHSAGAGVVGAEGTEGGRSEEAGGPHAGDAEAHPELVHPERDELELAAVLHALSDPMRLRIVAKLAVDGGEHTCKSFDLPIVKSTCTHHFKVLREAGLIRQRIVGTTKVNSLRSEDLEARFPGLLGAVLSDISVTS